MIETIITSSVLIVAITLIRFIFSGKISRQMQYALWGIVLIRLCIPITLFVSPFSIMNAVNFKNIRYEAVSQQVQPVQQITSEVNKTGTDEPIEVINAPIQNNISQNTSIPLTDLLKIFWIAGSIIVGLWFAGANLVFYLKLRKKRCLYEVDGCRRPVYLVDGLASPCLFGLLRPTVYLTPKAVASQDILRHVMVHELCHYRHGDYIWSFARGICLSVYWWNPLVWVAAILSHTDSELACDEAAIKQIGEDNRLAYGHTLIEMIAVKKSHGGLLCTATTMISGKQDIKKRLNLIVKNPKVFLPAVVGVILAVVLSVGCTFTGAKGDSFSAKDGGKLEKSTDLQDASTVSSSYNLTHFGSDKKVISTIALRKAEDKQIAEKLIANYMVTSAAWPGVDIATLDEYWQLHVINKSGQSTDYYLFIKDKNPVMQMGEKDGQYSQIDDKLYEKLTKLLPSKPNKDGMDNMAADEIDRTDLEACIHDAIMNENQNVYKRGDLATESHVVLKTVKKGEKTTVYAMVLYLEFEYSENNFKDTSGSHVPVAITFRKNTVGEYKLVEYWIPQDGTYYAPSIKKKFPADIYKKAIDTQAYIQAQIQACYHNAVEYKKIDANQNIKKLFDVIMASPAESSNPQSYIDKHPIDYRELLYYGDYTLRYVFAEFLKGGQTGLKGQLMFSVMRDLIKGENMRLSATGTAQERFDKWKKLAVSTRDANSMKFMKEHHPKAYILLKMIN